MFDRQPTLSDGEISLRPLEKSDRHALHSAASDPLIWELHPNKNRHRSEVFDPYFDFLFGMKSTLIVQKAGKVIGCSAYYTAPDQPETISIGFTFLIRNEWGGGTNYRMKSLMLDHAFDSFDAVWLHIGPENYRSQKATEKIGAAYLFTSETDLGTGPFPQCYYKLARSVWRDRVSQ